MRHSAIVRSALAAAAALLSLAASPAAAEPRIFIASDSTAANYAVDRYPQVGWGMMLPCGLAADVEVINRAIGRRSTRTFISEGYCEQLNADDPRRDIVLMQLRPQ